MSDPVPLSKAPERPPAEPPAGPVVGQRGDSFTFSAMPAEPRVVPAQPDAPAPAPAAAEPDKAPPEKPPPTPDPSPSAPPPEQEQPQRPVEWNVLPLTLPLFPELGEVRPHTVEAEPAPAEVAELPAAPALEIAPSADVAPTAGRIGVLLVNLGSPDAPEAPAVRAYLKEFLSDPRVIEKTGLLWKIAFHGFILPLRSRRKAHDYKRIWNRQVNDAPLKVITRAQAETLALLLEPLGDHVIVDWAMRYANPSIASRLEHLGGRGCDRILIMPLYPQYAGATTATVGDEVFRFMMRQRRQPSLRFVPAYYDDPGYIDALASTLKTELKALSFGPDVIIASYHGIPKEYVTKGDPYESQCQRTTRLLRHRMGYNENRLLLTYQSRFGRAEWLEPSTIKTVKELAKSGVRNLVVVTPGFAADCLETLEEIAVENARVFKRHGGQNFAVIPCLNDSAAGMHMIAQLAMRELRGWV